MASVYTVTLGLSDKPRFPKRCIVCSQLSPDTRIGVGDFVVSWFGFVTDIPEGWGEVQVPIHNWCKWRFRGRRWLTRLAYFALIGILYWLCGSQIQEMFPRPLRRIGLKVVFTILLIPVVFIEKLFPPRFDMTVYSETIEYEFLDSDYADEFAHRNADNVWR